MKNKFLFIMIALIIILSCIILIFGTNTDKYFKEITYTELEEKMDNKESFPLLIMSTSCSHCKSFEPKYKKVLSAYEVNSFYVNLENLSDEEKEKLSDLTSYEGTPTVVFIKNGSLMKTSIEGDKDKSVVISVFKRTGFIK